MSATEKTMTCATCGRRRQYPDGFPNRSFAECWLCAWNGHIRSSHPEVGRRIRREAKKRAKRIKRREVEAAMFSFERAQVLGVEIDEEASA